MFEDLDLTPPKQEHIFYRVSQRESPYGMCHCKEERIEHDDYVLVIRCSSCHFEELRDYRCLGINQTGRRCQASINLISGYCHRHTYQENSKWQMQELDFRAGNY